MRKFQYNKTLKYIELFKKLHEGIKEALEKKDIVLANKDLMLCHEKAIELGTFIEECEGLGFVTVGYLENYCEFVYQINEQMIAGEELKHMRIFKDLNQQSLKIENSLKNDVKIHREAVFLPYKASMWDSLESIWMAADGDPDTDAYVIPIPYFDRNPDGSFKEMHWEGEQYPDYVPITKYEEFDFGQHRPDMIFIHNPYDDKNYVTSIHPFFYSDKLKQFTDCLVYVPYFATAGAMSEGQKFAPVYENVDYIVVQSEKFINFYDESIPRQKFLALGSPKFDAVIRKCQNPPEPPEEWKEKMKGKKVYFYNTSLNGMLADTETFLDKMEYVFRVFREHPDACLLWRPHPLFESTLASMRPELLDRFREIRDKYLEEGLGIYDTTPSVENTIALCDAYVGDAASSVVALFGVAGKEIFILNNNLTVEPTEDDWKAWVMQHPLQTEDGVFHNKYCITQNDNLYVSENDDMRFKFMMHLTDYMWGGYYWRAFDYKDKVYVFPNAAQNILVINPKTKHIRKIELERKTEYGAFGGASIYKGKAYLWPIQYPDLVIFDMETEKIDYVSGIRDFNVYIEQDLSRIPAVRWFYKDNLYIMRADGNEVLEIDVKKPAIKSVQVPFSKLLLGAASKKINDDELWLLPYEGTIVTRWNMATGEIKDFDLNVTGLEMEDRSKFGLKNVRFFCNLVVKDDYVIASPQWGNKFVKLDINSEKAEEFETPFYTGFDDKSPYDKNGGAGYFYINIKDWDEIHFVSGWEHRDFIFDIDTKETRIIDQSFDKEDVFAHAGGYGVCNEWLRYACSEDVYNTLADYLEEKISGNRYSQKEQLESYGTVNASPDGDCGQKVFKKLINQSI